MAGEPALMGEPALIDMEVAQKRWIGGMKGITPERNHTRPVGAKSSLETDEHTCMLRRPLSHPGMTWGGGVATGSGDGGGE